MPQHGAAVRRVPARGGAAADRAGHEPRVRAPGRAGEPRARALQVRGQEAGHRGVQAARAARSAPDAAPRPALDGVPRRPARPRREAASARRARCRRGRIPTASLPGETTNVIPQRQPGYVDRRPSRCRSATSRREQARALADVARKYTGDTMRTTVEQNLLLRWVQRGGPARRSTRRLKAIGLADAGRRHDHRHHRLPRHRHLQARHLVVARPRGRAAQAAARSRASTRTRTPKHLHIKASGCFNSCGQHHVADIGFLGVSRNVGGRRVPHFQLVVGGQWTNNAGVVRPGDRRHAVEARARGRQAPHRSASPRSARATSPSPTSSTASARRRSARWSRSCRRCPPTTRTRATTRDWGDPREYTIGDMGDGRVRGRGGAATSSSSWPRPSASCSRRSCCWTRSKLDAAARGAPSRRCCRRRGRWRARRTRTSAATRTRSSASSASTSRHAAVLRPVRGGEVRAVPLPRPRGAARKSRAARGGGAPADRGGDAVRRRRPPVLYALRARSRPRRRPPYRLSHIAPETMDAHKLQLKIYLTPESARAVDLEDLIPVFHRWIKQRLLPELTIDVANYRHVPQGPGVVLIGHGSDYFMDEGEGRPGLLHNRKRAGLAPGERLTIWRGGRCTRRRCSSAIRPWRQAELRDQRAALPRQRPPRRAQQRRDVRRAAAELERCARALRRPFELARVGGAEGAVRRTDQGRPARRWRCCSSAGAGRPPRTRRW